MAPRLITRRGLMGAFACCGAGALAVDAALVEPRWLEITRRDVPVPDLPASLDGFTIAQLSDLHLTELGSLEEEVLAQLRRSDVGLVVISGDAVETATALPSLEALVAELDQIPGADVVATMGNWEHWGDIPFDVMAGAYRRAGGLLLGNEGKLVGSGVLVVGTDDHCVGLDDLGAAVEASPRGGVVRLLATHAPGHLDDPPPGAPKFDLCLAGHTHGGQIRPGFTMWTPPGSGRFVAGAYDTPAGLAYVSRGIGTSVLAVRLGSRPELPLFRLVRG